jgi:4-amino-4-deoxy-L-arabinose transferase-like glycosyltransferase
VSSAVPQVAPPAITPAPGPTVPRAVGRLLSRLLGRGLGRLPRPAVALGVVLAAQAALSLRLTWTNTAFQDEALYLRAGHLEWAHWTRQAPIPDFPAYFSGAPVAYPPVAALADSAGGLTAARLLSLACMLGVTGLLWAATARLYGRRAALLATGLFATLTGTQFLGSLATFDSPALLLLALAAWLGVRAAGSARPLARAGLLAGAGLALAAADVTKYAAALFTPVVIAVLALAAWRQRPGWGWLGSAATALAAWAVPVAAAIAVGGPAYRAGLTTTTLDRPAAATPVTSVLRNGYVWTSLILVLAVLGVWLSARSRERARVLPAVLLAAALLAPAEQARLHTEVSLQKHVVFGAWFAAMAAGYALARLSRVDRGYGWAVVMALPIAAATLFGSMGQAHFLHRDWPDSTALIRVLRPAVRAHPGSYLAEDDDVEAYYLRGQVRWQDWSGTYYFRYRDEPAGAASYAAAIAQHHFALIILDFGDTAAADRQIAADLRHTGGYHVLAHAGRFTVWALRTGITPSGGASVGH